MIQPFMRNRVEPMNWRLRGGVKNGACSLQVATVFLRKTMKNDGIWGTKISDKPGINWETRIRILQPYYILQKPHLEIKLRVWTVFYFE